MILFPGGHRLEPFKYISDLDSPRYCLHLFKGNEFLEILVTERMDEKVIFRKNRSINMDVYDFAKGNHSRPYVNPAWQLLFKSLSTREEDEHDFRIYMDRVNDNSSKKWLLRSIIEANGNRNWISKLEGYFKEGEPSYNTIFTHREDQVAPRFGSSSMYFDEALWVKIREVF